MSQSPSLLCAHWLCSLKQLLFTTSKTRSPDWNPQWCDITLTLCKGPHVHLEVIQTVTTQCSLIGFAGLNKWVQFVLGTSSPFSDPLAWALGIVCVLLSYLTLVTGGCEGLLPVVSLRFQGFHRLPVARVQEPLPSSSGFASSDKYVHCSTTSDHLGRDE